MENDEYDMTGGFDEQQLINVEHEIWKSTSRFLYYHIIDHALERPSPTVEWLPYREEQTDNDYIVQKMILGTGAFGNALNYLIIAQVRLPREDTEDHAGQYDDEHSEFSGFGNAEGKVQYVQQIPHDGEVIQARHMPQNQFIIATRTVADEVYVFDCEKHPPNPHLDGACNPDWRLRGHSAEGHGLSWSQFWPGHLLSCSDDAQICLWDLNATPYNMALDAMQMFKIGKHAVEDVAWHQSCQYLFGSVGDDHCLHIWDLRDNHCLPIQTVVAHQREVYSLAFNPINEWLIATGSADKTVKLFDIRKISSALYSCEQKEEVLQVGWNPKKKSVFASCCIGRRMMVWDLSRIGNAQTTEESKEGPPELLFIHGGHTSEILDFSWNPCEDWVIASVAEDNILQIWEMAEHVYNDDCDLPGSEPFSDI